MLMTNLTKIRLLSKNERRLLLKSVLLLPVIHIALLILDYYRLRKVMENLTPLKPIDKSVSEKAILQRAQEIAQIVSIAAQYGLYKATCLRRSLLVWWFLRKEGVGSKICFGVRMSECQLEAHAWVEYQGTIVNDSLKIHDQYTVLDEVLPLIRTGL